MHKKLEHREQTNKRLPRMVVLFFVFLLFAGLAFAKDYEF